MATTYYNLPTITPETVANGPDAINGLANATDAALHGVEALIPTDSSLDEIEAKADTAATNAAAALNTATAASQTAQTAQTNAGTAISTANAAQASASANASAITALANRTSAVENMLNFTQFTTFTPTRTGMFNYNTGTYLGTGASGATYTKTGGTLNVATTDTGEYFKCYGGCHGRVTGTVASGEMPVIGIPLSAVGLETPSENITIAGAGLGIYFGNSTLQLQSDSIVLCTDGYLYAEASRSVAGSTINNYFFPCIYQAKQFGDTSE